MLSLLIRLSSIATTIYFAVLTILYLFQENFIFLPTQLAENHTFKFESHFEEINLKSNNVTLNGLRFYAPNPKGAILFFHGNTGSLENWGKYAETLTDFGYDIYLFDYQGYGKSSGKISNQDELFTDTDKMMDYVLEDFDINQIKLIGYSLGSGLAARVATKFNVKELILIAPYFKFTELVQAKIPFVPTFLIKYKIPTVDFIANATQTRITIVHGKNDEVIEVSNSYQLSSHLKKGDKFIELDSGHNDILMHSQLWQLFADQF